MQRIDTHSHAVPPGWRKYCMDLGWEKPDGMAGIPEWSVETHLDLMNRAHISQSILSITSPGTFLAPGDIPLCRQITRETNAELSSICASHPARFSFFASLPLPDVEGSLVEIDHALDDLGAKGFAILTNVNGVYLGDQRLDPVFAKLDQRNAVVMIHPTTCRLASACEHQQQQQQQQQQPRASEVVVLPEYPRPMLDFFFDTARAVTHLLLSKTVERYQNIKWIVPHCGAVLPPVIERFTAYSARVYGKKDSLSSDDVRSLFKTRFYFDLAGFPFPDQIHGLLRFADVSRLLYGTDFPFLPADAVVDSAERNDRDVRGLFGEEGQRSVYRENARELLNLQ